MKLQTTLKTVKAALITRYLLILAALAVICLLLSPSFIGSVSAADVAQDPVHTRCRELLKGSAKEACDKVDTNDKYSGDSYINIFHARNVATYQCRDKSDADKADCVTNQAIKYIEAAAKGNPSAKNFETKLDSVLSAADGSPNRPAEDSGALAPSGDSGFTAPTSNTCGGDDSAVKTSINIGCKGKGNGVLDFTFAMIRFLSNGVGLVLIGSLIYGGIQFSLSRGNPQANAAAQNRIKSVIVAMFVFLFAYALLNYLVPGKILQ